MGKIDKYDLVIPIVSKDVDLVTSNIDLYFNNLQVNQIVFIGQKIIKDSIEINPKIHFIDEDELLESLHLKTIEQILHNRIGQTRRSGWYFQQFLKMGYSLICKNEFYLVWDSDTIPVNMLSFISQDRKPFLSYINYNKQDQCYQKTLTKLTPSGFLQMNKTKSFIVEHMLINTSIMKQLLHDIESNNQLHGNNFYEKILYAIPTEYLNLSGFSEFETYAAYVLKYHRDKYILRHWKNARYGKIFLGQSPNREQLSWISSLFDTVSIEKFNRYWYIFKVFNYYKLYKKIKFKYLYYCFHPIIEAIYISRVKLRNILK